ncbi:MAG: hypothetical protein OEW95_09825 [Candidatus Bathyarchaeota archaeon]|nr:hypothetical protein [Candidatus Bathyarchaeota archaeon]
MLFVSITRWTPETARALQERWMMVVNGTAPKPVLDAFAKYKIMTQVISPTNRFSFMVAEVKEKDYGETLPLSMWLQDVCTQEAYTVVSMEDFFKALETLPMEKIPKPEQWYRSK